MLGLTESTNRNWVYPVPGRLDLVIREAKQEDAESISKLICLLSAKFISHEFTTEGKETLLNSMSVGEIKKHIQTGFKFFLALEDNHIVGVVGIKDNRHLYHLFVAERYQRRGIATRLWQVAMQACIEAGNPGEFSVNSSIFAEQAYKAFGFVVQSEPQVKNGVVYIPMKLKIDRG